MENDQQTVTAYKGSDLQLGMISAGATPTVAMTHKMGLAKINCGSKAGVYNSMYYLTGEKNTYNWAHDATTSTVYSSTTFTNQTLKPFVSNHVCYYIVDGSASLGGDNEFPADDNGNGWTTSTGTIGSGCYKETTLSNPTLQAKQWTAYTIAIGDVLYQDGALSHYGSAIYSTRTAIAIVFKTGRGHSGDPAKWTHGYALALREFNECRWSSTNVTVNSSYITTYDALIADYAGYSKTVAITKYSGYSSSTFPAAYKAWNYSAKSKNGTSYVSLSGNLTTVGAHWFLPSSGQWYLIIKNLGGVTDHVPTGSSGYQWTWVKGSNSSYDSATCRDRINTYIEPIISAGYTTSTVSPTTINLETENVAVRRIPYVSAPEHNANPSKPTYDNTYKTSSETGTNIICVVLFGAAPDLCMTLGRTGDGYEKTPATKRDSMRPIIGF